MIHMTSRYASMNYHVITRLISVRYCTREKY